MRVAFHAMQLCKNYGRTAVLNGLDLEVAEATVYGLIGPNGAGKTTTIKILMNLLQPTSGSADVLGVDSRRIGPADLTRIGYVSENQEMPEWMTVEQFLSYWKPFYRTWDDGRAEELLRQFELPPHRKLKHLSRGMRMKAALASSLAYRPQLLILDEPFSGLDPLVREDLIEGLRASATDTTVFVSSHDLGEIESFATHIGYLDRGRLQFSEEMKMLSARFREIEVTAESPMVRPADGKWPPNWLRAEVNVTGTKFIEARFHPESTPAAVRQIFGESALIRINPVPLRTIFITLARQASKV